MFAVAAAVLIFVTKATGWVEDTSDFSWFWLGVSLFVLHFGFGWAVTAVRSYRKQ